jgi:hypothetical protein
VWGDNTDGVNDGGATAGNGGVRVLVADAALVV